jgi:hypothetical protein
LEGVIIMPWVQATKDNIKVGMKTRVKARIKDPKYEWGEVNRESVGEITRIDRGENEFYVAFPKHPSWLAYIPEMEVEIVETKSKLEQLEETIAKAQQEIKELREQEKKAKRPCLKIGQIWKRIQSDSYYIVNREKMLINLNSGEIWTIRGGFGGKDKDFTYVGLAKDLVQIKES